MIKLNNERMIHSNKDVSFGHDMVLLFSFFNIFLLEDLHGVDTFRLLTLLLDEDHLGI